MSIKEEQSQDHNLRAGLAMFHTPLVHRTDLDGEDKSNDQASVKKDSNTSYNTSPVNKVHTTASSSTPSTVKLVGSHRIFVPSKK